MKNYPDAQFSPTQESVSSLLAMYDLQLISYKLADSGIENCTILAKTRQGKYVLRVYPQHKKSDAAIQREIDFIIYLQTHNMPVAPVVMNSTGKHVTHFNQVNYIWQAILMPHMPGGHAAHYSDKLLSEIATTQASMHNLAAVYDGRAAFDGGLTELREGHFIKLIEDREKLDSRYQAFTTRAEEYVVHLDPTLPRGLCHLDFDSGNILSKDDSITAILDFDDLTVAPYIMCPAYTLWHIVMDRGLGIIDSYIEAYEKLRPLSRHEKANIKPIMLFRHYVVGCMKIADSRMDKQMLTRYLELENKLLS